MTPTQLIDAAQERAGLSQAALARVLGVERTSIMRWRRGIHPMSRRTRLLFWFIGQYGLPRAAVFFACKQELTLNNPRL
jgi:transcriptional regulator with XRE-family HTH domain